MHCFSGVPENSLIIEPPVESHELESSLANIDIQFYGMVSMPFWRHTNSCRRMGQWGVVGKAAGAHGNQDTTGGVAKDEPRRAAP